MELHKTLIDEGRGAAGAEEAAEETFRRDTASKMMQELSKTGYQTLEKETLKEEQAAQQECPEKSKKAESRRWSKVTREDTRREEEKSAEIIKERKR